MSYFMDKIYPPMEFRENNQYNYSLRDMLKLIGVPVFIVLASDKDFFFANLDITSISFHKKSLV